MSRDALATPHSSAKDSRDTELISIKYYVPKLWSQVFPLIAMHSTIPFFAKKVTGMLLSDLWCIKKLSMFTGFKSLCVFVLPRWCFCCCGLWRTVVHWAPFSFPSRGAGSCGSTCAGIWVSCRVKAVGTEGLKTRPLRLAVPGRYWLPVKGKEIMLFDALMCCKLHK